MTSYYPANKILLTALILACCLPGCGNTERQPPPIQEAVKKFVKAATRPSNTAVGIDGNIVS